jgi:mercuric ion binding protein
MTPFFIRSITPIILATFLSCNNSADKKNTTTANTVATFKVWGNCDMCKETIESSLKVEGIAKADWNTETKIIEVSYDSTITNLDKIQKNIASVGYDNEIYKRDDSAYNNLRDCCKYDRK